MDISACGVFGSLVCVSDEFCQVTGFTTVPLYHCTTVSNLVFFMSFSDILIF